MRAVRVMVSAEALREALYLDENKKVCGVEYDPFTNCYTFLIKGNDLPKVREGCRPQEARIVITEHVQVFKEKNAKLEVREQVSK